MRLARTTSNGGSPLGQAALPGVRTGGPSPLRRALAVVASTAIGSVSRPSAVRRAELERGDGEDPRAAADIEDARAGEDARGRPAPRRRRGTAASSGGAPSRTPCRGRGRGRRRRAAPVPSPGRPDDQPAADAQDREVGLPRLGPVVLVDEPRPQLADRAQPERLEMSERLGDLGRGPLGGGTVAGRQVGRGRSPAGSGRSARRAPRRRARTRARPTCRRAPPDRGSR